MCSPSRDFRKSEISDVRQKGKVQPVYERYLSRTGLSPDSQGPVLPRDFYFTDVLKGG